jgi:tetratricopeptide (TPR) repeat protein
MKKWISFILILVISSCYAEENETTWEDFWVSGIYSCSQKNYKDAVFHFTESINLLNAAQNANFPQIYIDRGIAYSLLFEFNNALNDFENAIQSNKLSDNDKVRLCVNKLAVLSSLDDHKNIFLELDNLKKIDPNFPQIEFTENYVFIRNVPANKWYRKAIKCLLIHSGMCSSKGDMYIYPSNILVAVKKGHCGCESCIDRDSKLQTCDQCAQPLQFNNSNIDPSTEEIESYTQCCDELALASTAWCVQMLKKTQSRLAGFYALDLIRQVASQVPQNENIYEQCITPFAELINNPEALSAPVWD